MQKTWVWSLGREYPLEKGMTTHSSILAWRIPWTEEPSKLQSIGSQRVRHDWATNIFSSHTLYPQWLHHFIFLPVVHCCCCCCEVASVVSDSVRLHRRQPTRLPHPWDSPGKNTWMGCHFLLQCIKVKSESEVAQSCPTLRDPMDCSLPGSSVHGIFQARVLEWGAIAFSVRIREKSKNANT